MGVSLQDVLSLILGHVSVMGWDACCWSDDALSSKKIYPKYQFPAKSKKWLPRVKSSEDSMRMLVQRVQATHEKTARFFQKKIDTQCVSREDIQTMRMKIMEKIDDLDEKTREARSLL